MKTEGRALAALLSEHKESILVQWLESALSTSSDAPAGFLSGEADRFRNPVSYTLRQGLSSVFEFLTGSEDLMAIKPALDGIVRMRAVQDISAGRALAFIFVLKRIIRAELPFVFSQFPDELAALETRIDEAALLAFDLFMECREQIYEIKASERKRMSFLLERKQLKNEPRSIEEERGE